jgi:hypothetical protein
MTGYLDRLVARGTGQAPSGLTPRRRSRYEDGSGVADGFRVEEAERVTPPVLGSGPPAATQRAVADQGLTDQASPADPTTRAAGPDRVDAPSPAHAVPDDFPPGQRAPAGPPLAAVEQTTSIQVPGEATTSLDAAPAQAVHAERAASPSTAPRTTASVALAAAAPGSSHAVPHTDIGPSPATIRLASTSDDTTRVDGGDVDPPAAWPLTASARPLRGGRRQAAEPGATEPVVVEVTIGRVEIRAVPEPAPVAARTSSAPPLSDYLRDRAHTNGGRR